MSADVQKLAQALYEVRPTYVMKVPATGGGFNRSDYEVVPWKRVRDEQWAIYFDSIDQAMAALEVLGLA